MKQIFPPRSAGFVQGLENETSRTSDGNLEPGRGGTPGCREKVRRKSTFADVTHRVCVTAGETANMGYWCNGSTRVTAKTMEAAAKRERVQFQHTPSISHPSAWCAARSCNGFSGWVPLKH